MENGIPSQSNWKQHSNQQPKDKQDAFEYRALKPHKYFAPDLLNDFYLSSSVLPYSHLTCPFKNHY
jgi:hypothetical protein